MTSNSIFLSTEDFKGKLPMIHRHFDWNAELKDMTIQAADLYVVKYMSQAEYDALATAYAASTMTAEQTALLPYVQRTIAWYTYMLMHDTHQVHMSPQGLQESYSDDGTSRPASAWAKLDSKSNAANFADSYLDKLLIYMEKEAVDNNAFSLWQGSAEYQAVFELLIWDSEQLGKFLEGGNSRRLLHDLQPSIRWVQERDILPVLGVTLYDALIAAVKNRPAVALAASYQALLDRIRPYIAKKALMEAIPMRRVELSNGGIFFRSYDGPLTKSHQATSDNAITHLLSRLDSQAESVKVSLLRWLDDHAADYPDREVHGYEYPDGNPGYKLNLKKYNGSVLL